MPVEAPAAPAATRSEPPSLDNFDRAFADVEDAPSPSTNDAPPASPTAPPASASKPPAGDSRSNASPIPPEPGKAKEADKPTTPATPPSKEGEEDPEPPSQGKASDLRNWGKRQMQKAAKFQKELADLKAQIEEQKQTPTDTPDVKALSEELATAKKRLEEYEGNLRLVKYEKSQEYDEKYRKPYQKAIQSAYAEVNELLVTETDEEGNEKERQATQADFDEIYQLPLGQAAKVAKAKFGDSAYIVLQHRNAIRNLAKEAVQAIEDNKGKAAEQEKQMTAQQAQQQQARMAMWQKVNQELETKYAKWFGKREGDEDWNKALDEGRKIADLAFSDRKGLTPQQAIILDAQVRNRVAAFPALKGKVTKLEAELAAATKTIEELRGSGPGKPKPNADAPEGKETWETALDKLPE